MNSWPLINPHATWGWSKPLSESGTVFSRNSRETSPFYLAVCFTNRLLGKRLPDNRSLPWLSPGKLLQCVGNLLQIEYFLENITIKWEQECLSITNVDVLRISSVTPVSHYPYNRSSSQHSSAVIALYLFTIDFYLKQKYSVNIVYKLVLSMYEVPLKWQKIKTHICEL